MTVQVVGGPNERADYHDDPVEEFYQLKGNMVLKVGDNGTYDVPIKEGTCSLPAHVRFFTAAPGRRPIGSWSSRSATAMNLMAEWYYADCTLVQPHRLKVKHWSKTCRHSTRRSPMRRRACKSCGAIHPGKKPPLGAKIQIKFSRFVWFASSRRQEQPAAL